MLLGYFYIIFGGILSDLLPTSKVGLHFLFFSYMLSFHFLNGINWSTKVLNLRKSILSIFSFVVYPIGVTCKALPNTKSWRFVPIFSTKRVVLSYTFRLMIHFEFIFVYEIRKGSNFIYLYVTIQLSLHVGWKCYGFPIPLSRHPCWKSIGHKYADLYLNSNSYPITLLVCQYHTVLITVLLL